MQGGSRIRLTTRAQNSRKISRGTLLDDRNLNLGLPSLWFRDHCHLQKIKIPRVFIQIQNETQNHKELRANGKSPNACLKCQEIFSRMIDANRIPAIRLACFTKVGSWISLCSRVYFHFFRSWTNSLEYSRKYTYLQYRKQNCTCKLIALECAYMKNPVA